MGRRRRREQTWEFLGGVADDTFVRRDELLYGNRGVVEHRVTFTARPQAPDKPPSSGKY